MNAELTPLFQQQKISELDFYFARFITRFDETESVDVQLAACLVSNAMAMGHTCVDLAQVAGKSVARLVDNTLMLAPPLSQWLATLRQSVAIGLPGQRCPLILDEHNRLYLYRYWAYEHQLAEALLAKYATPVELLDENRLQLTIKQLFATPETIDETDEVDWQQIAAVMAVRQRFCIISGGPGTGKTTTVIKLLALLLTQVTDRKLTIRLTAPTGKAAARLQDAIRAGKQQLAVEQAIVAEIPEMAETIHRLLGYHPDTQSFRFHAKNLLPVDVLVVDEASMIDLALMTRLVLALPQQARLILLGDKDQLASIEAGSVLHDLCAEHVQFSAHFMSTVQRLTSQKILADPCAVKTVFQDAIVLLKKSHRFNDDSDVGRLAQSIKLGDTVTAIELLTAEENTQITLRTGLSYHQVVQYIDDVIISAYSSYWQSVKNWDDPSSVLQKFDQCRVLCALRIGPLGALALNGLIEKRLAKHFSIDTRQAWYAGRPIMITRNDYRLKLYNGDVGICLVDKTQNKGQLRVYFLSTESGIRDINSSQLPAHETVYAMTIHKSQGAEFDRVVLVLPSVSVNNHPDSEAGMLDESAVFLTRELLYTGITRAKNSVEIWSTETVLRETIAQQVSRSSGLRERLADGLSC